MKKTILLLLFGMAYGLCYSARNEEELNQALQEEAHRRAEKEVEEIKKHYEWIAEHRPSANTIPLAPNTDATAWVRDPSNTNGVVVSVFVGAYREHHRCTQPFFRDLTFDKDGKLVSVSPARLGEFNNQILAYLPAPAITNNAHARQHTPPRDK